MKESLKKRITAAILAMEFTSLAMSAVSPALADLGEAFPFVPQMFITMLSTMPALICMPVGIWSNAVAGRLLRFRTLAITGFICLCTGGFLPIWLNHFFAILLCRVIFGVGMGLIQPLGTTIVFMFFTKREAEIQSGNDTIMNNIGAVVFQLGGGILCGSFGWRATFLIYLALIPCFLVVLFVMPEPDTSSFVKREQEIKKENGRIRYGWNVWRWCLLYGLFCVLFYPLVTDSSVIIMNNGYGSAAGASVLLTLFTLGGVCGGILFRHIASLGRRMFSLIFCICAAGFFLEIIADNLIVMVIGGIVFGISYGLFMAAVMIFAGYSVPQEIRPGVTARIFAAAGIGEFSSAFIMEGIGKLFGNPHERFPFILSLVVFLIFALVFIKKPEEEFAADEKTA